MIVAGYGSRLVEVNGGERADHDDDFYHANPTFTIVQVALRLADHLAAKS